MRILRFMSNRKSSDYVFRLRRIAFLLFISLAITGCQTSDSSHSDIMLNWEVTPDPPQVGKAKINITLTDSTQQLLEGAEIQLQGNMSHPGMKPVVSSAKEVSPGKYSAPFEFTMGGDWFILIESRLADERVVERQIEVNGVQSE